MDEFELAIDALKAKFLIRLEAERDDLVAAKRGPDRAALHDMAHRMAGSAGVFGFPRLSQQAAALQKAVRDDGARHDPTIEIDRLLAEIDAALERR